MPATWPKERRLLGTKVPRLDGPEKSTGLAKYSFDINRPGMIYAAMLRCPYAHAKIKSIDTSAAEKMPGFKAVHLVSTPGAEMFFAGMEVLGIAADTEEHCADALRAVRVDYEVLEHLVKEEDALKDPNKRTVAGKGGNVSTALNDTKGNAQNVFDDSNMVVHQGTYGAAAICHQCLESHGLVAEWGPDDSLTVWCSTQASFFTAQGLATHFKIPATKVKCITHFMGGGFGSKFGPDIQGTTAAELARKAKAPVKLMLDRAEEVIAGGMRPSAFGTVKMGASKDGKILAYSVDCYGTSGIAGSRTVGPLPYVYPFENTVAKHQLTRLNAQQQRAMRAPGHPQSCFLTDCPLDDLAAKLGMDPMQVRLKNLPPNDDSAVKKAPTSLPAIRGSLYVEQIKLAAQLAEWDKKWHPPGKGAEKGPVKRGLGMALHTWGGAGGPNNDVTVTISSDGSVLATSSTQDLGTGERTVLAIIIAETLGLEPKDITVRIGESPYGRSGGSGGSTTCPGTAPACLNAVTAAKEELFKAIAERLGNQPGDLSTVPGKIVGKDGKSWVWKEACAKLGMNTATGKGNWTPGLSNNGVCGVQVAEVAVDTETGVVRCVKMVAVQDCGLLINKLCCESQVAGGVIMGVNYALFEERILDRQTGRQVNPDMEFYKLGGIEDMPRIVVHMMDMPERGVIGIGEPPTISTAAAIGNAVFNAIGVRVPIAPYTPERVLEALAKA